MKKRLVILMVLIAFIVCFLTLCGSVDYPVINNTIEDIITIYENNDVEECTEKAKKVINEKKRLLQNEIMILKENIKDELTILKQKVSSTDDFTEMHGRKLLSIITDEIPALKKLNNLQMKMKEKKECLSNLRGFIVKLIKEDQSIDS